MRQIAISMSFADSFGGVFVPGVIINLWMRAIRRERYQALKWPELSSIPASISSLFAGGRASKTVHSQAEPGNECFRSGDGREVSYFEL